MQVYLDSEDASVQPSLKCEEIREERWNGWAVPVATAAAFHAFIAEWLDNDPNGTWWPSGVMTRVGDGALFYANGEGDVDSWSVVDSTADGVPLFALDGYCWITADAVAK